MRLVRIVAATAAAVALQTTVDRWLPAGTVDLVLVVVVYTALTAGRVTGLLAGTFAGLVQDALGGSVVGIAGLSKTVVGFLAGIVGTQFIVTHTVSRFVVFFLATVLNAVVFMGLYEMLGLREFDRPIGAVAVQALANALVGVLVFQASELMPGVVERRRNSQAARVRR